MSSSVPKKSSSPGKRSAGAESDGSGPGRSNGQERAGTTTPPTAPRRTADLIEKIRESTDKLAADRTTRGDLKILSRTLQELRYAFKVFTPYRSVRKVTIFGSARTPPEAACYRQAVEFGQAMAGRGWLVVTGAASGIMEAGHVGAGREHSMGLNILLPFEQTSNAVIAGDSKLVYMKYFFTRKLMFVKESHAMCLLPGGFGTLDEALEVLTLLQTGKRDLLPVVFLDEPGGDFWAHFREFVQKKLAGRKMIDADDMALFTLTDRVPDAVAEILRFYRVYHSMRYVRDRLVLRLQETLDDDALEEVNVRFADILVEGRFTQGGPLAEEKDEPDLAGLPRLIFHFNRQSFGRLRQLIDHLNSATGC